MNPTPIDRRPARFSSALAVGAAIVAVVAAGRYSVAGAAAGLAGLLFLASGLAVGRQVGVSVGAVGLFAGVVYGGVLGAHPVVLLVGVAATVVAWDAGGTAIDVGAQLGREADTARVELVHAAGSLAVGTATIGVGYGVYLTAGGGQPTAALLLLLVAVVLLLATLDRT